MKRFTSTTEFITGAFIGSLLATICFTFVLVLCYTPNNLLELHGFYKDGKHYKVVESEKLRKCRNYE